MERATKWLTLALILGEIALVRLGLLDLSTAIGVVVGIEALLLIVGGRQVVVAARRYRQNRTAGLDVWAALEDGLAVLLPRVVARVVALEPKLWLCLALWLLRRKSAANEFSYHKRSAMGVLILAVLFSTPVEILLFELLVPWEWVRWALLIASVYAMIWVFGFYASLVMLPHSLRNDRLCLNYGLLASGQIPCEQIAEVTIERKRAPGGNEGLKVSHAESAAYMAIGGRTDVTLRLHQPLQLRGVLRPTAPVCLVHVAVDDPRRFASELSEKSGVQRALSVTG